MMVEMSLQMRFSSSKNSRDFGNETIPTFFVAMIFRLGDCHWLDYFRLNFIEWKLYNTFSKLSFNFWQVRMQIANKFCKPTPFERPLSIPSDRNSYGKYGVRIHFGDLCAATIFIFTIYKYSKNEFWLTQHHPNSLLICLNHMIRRAVMIQTIFFLSSIFGFKMLQRHDIRSPSQIHECEMYGHASIEKRKTCSNSQNITENFPDAEK